MFEIWELTSEPDSETKTSTTREPPGSRVEHGIPDSSKASHKSKQYSYIRKKI